MPIAYTATTMDLCLDRRVSFFVFQKFFLYSMSLFLQYLH